MTQRIVVHRGAYRDSAFLMRVARELQGLKGVDEAVVLMGTPMNRELLTRAGFSGEALLGATPLDLVVALEADEPAALDLGEREVARLLSGDGAAATATGVSRYGSLDEALSANPDANLVEISVPGAYAAWVARRALDHGRHVFLFSNNVELADEVELKRRGRELGLLVMGPDCGTAIIGGVGLGFANRVPRGHVGIVGASGTGIQEVSCLVARLGKGVSQAIGTGSRDLSSAVGGAMTEVGLGLLDEDPATHGVLLVAKHPAGEVAERLHGLLKALHKPAVVRYLGEKAPASRDGVFYASSLDEAARAAAALASPADDGGAVEAVAERTHALLAGRTRVDGRLVGLFGGGSLASEAKLALEGSNLKCWEPQGPLASEGPVEIDGHLVVDTGEDFYTVGKPHPMVDQTVRCALVAKAVADPTVGVVLLDLVLGDGAHADPAPELAAAIGRGKARRRGPPPVVVASVTGTDLDPQDASRQRRALEAAGVEVQASAARAAGLSARLLAGRQGRAR